MIIGLCGHKGAGKSTVSETAINLYASKRVYFRIGFADAMYDMLAAMGVPLDVVYNKTRWDEPLEILAGRTCRHACVTLGTEWGRKQLGESVWTALTIRRAREIIGRQYVRPNVVIIDNVRFPDEADAILDAGGHMIAFRRHGLEVDLSHESEKHIPDIQRQKCAHGFFNCGHDLQWVSRNFFELIENLT
jgi:hypothetical protein